MAKVTGPLLSFTASGTVGGVQTYSKWRGIDYVRTRVTPANPNTANQVKTRSVFTWLMAVYKLMAADLQAPWKAYSTGQKFTDRNAFVKSDLPALRAGVDLTGFIASPSTGGAPAFTNFAAVGGAGSVTVTADDPVLPTGWAVSKFIAGAIVNDDPHTSTNYTSYTGSDAASPYSVALAVPAGTYMAFAFFEYTKPDGTLAYSISQAGSAVAT